MGSQKNIEIRNLNKSYGNKKVLENFNATFEYGTVTCLMGESGCGKTTLVMSIIDMLDEKPAVIFQEDRLCEDFDAIENVRLVNDECDAVTVLLSLGIADEDMKRPVKELSGGQKRRVSIARALACRDKSGKPRELLIMDEAFKGLDEKTREKVAKEILKYYSFIIMVAHDADEAELMGAEVLKLEKLKRD